MDSDVLIAWGAVVLFISICAASATGCLLAAGLFALAALARKRHV